MSSDIKIFVSCHKPSKLPKCELFVPIQVGADISDVKMNMLRDNTGDNISAKNKNYCELTAQYWVWKNVEADYYGFCHYRRFFSFSPNKIGVNSFGYKTYDMLNNKVERQLHLDKKSIQDMVEKYDILLADSPDYSLYGHRDLYSQYETSHGLHIEDLKLAIRVLKDTFPDYSTVADKYMNSTYMYPCNMFVMRKELFREYSNWLFNILLKIESLLDYSDYSEEGIRTIGHISERLLGIFCLYQKLHGKRIKCLEWGFIEKTDPWYYPIPAFQTNAIPIVFSCEDVNLPVLAVAIQSLKECGRKNYDVIILHTNIPVNRQYYFIKTVGGQKNLSIRFIDFSCFIENSGEELNGSIELSECILFIPELMINFKRVLFCNCNVLFLEDPAHLFLEDITKYSIAAVVDIDHASKIITRRTSGDSCNRYKKNGYIDTEVILFNLEMIRKQFGRFALYFHMKKNDLTTKDAMNTFFADSILFLPQKWNVIPAPFLHNGFNIYRRCVPVALYREYEDAKQNPAIIRYREDEKPLLTIDCEFAEKYWEIARTTPYYEESLRFMLANFIKCKKSAKVNGINRFCHLMKKREKSF